MHLIQGFNSYGVLITNSFTSAEMSVRVVRVTVQEQLFLRICKFPTACNPTVCLKPEFSYSEKYPTQPGANL